MYLEGINTGVRVGPRTLAVLLLVSSMLLCLGGGSMDAEPGAERGTSDISVRYAEGSGTPSDPYQICNVTQLQEMGSDLNAHYVLASDIDASGTSGWNHGSGFEPVGNQTDPFNGTLDGRGLSISDLWIRRSHDVVGLFGCLGTAARVANVTIKDCDVRGEDQAGALAGVNLGTIVDCRASGTLQGMSRTGGIVGINLGTMDRCRSSVSLSNGARVGGLVGVNSGGVVRNCSADGSLNGNNRIVGGLVGENMGTVMESYSSGDVSGWWYIGGLVGHNQLQGAVRDCYSTSDVSVTLITASTGGLIGLVRDGTVQHSFSMGSISGSPIEPGGLVGSLLDGTVDGCFWDNQTSGMDVSEGGTGKVTAEMKQESTFSGAGWDLDGTWDIVEGRTYPFLRHQLRELVISPTIGPNETATEDEPFYRRMEAEVCWLPGLDNSASFSLLTDVPWLSMTRSGAMSGTPSNDDVGTWELVIVAVDELNSTDSFDLTLKVVNVNDEPSILTEALPDSFEDESYLFHLEAIDIDPTEDALTWELVDSTAGFLGIDPLTGDISGLPVQDDVGTHAVTVRVSDGEGGTDVRQLSLKVLNTNDPPTVLSESLPDATEDQEYILSLVATDPDPTGDLLTWRPVGAFPGFLKLDHLSGTISGMPGNDDVGVWWVNVSVEDGRDGVGYAALKLTVLNVNDPPEITTTSLPDAIEDEPYKVTLDGFDIDPPGDVLTWSIVATDADFMMVGPSTGELSGTPGNEHVGEWSVDVRLSDGNGGIATVTLMVTVVNVNDAPKITTSAKTSATEDQVYSVRYLGTDIDPTGDILEWSFKTNAGFLSFDAGTGQLEGVPANEDVGEWWVNIALRDGKGGVTETNFTLTVLNVNDAPVITELLPVNGTKVEEGRKVQLSLTYEDEDGDEATVTWMEGTKELGTGPSLEVRLKPGRHVITVVVDDGTDRVEGSLTVVVEEEEGGGWALIVAAVLLAAVMVVLAAVLVRRRSSH